jgi:hypothetical protein
MRDVMPKNAKHFGFQDLRDPRFFAGVYPSISKRGSD